MTDMRLVAGAAVLSFDAATGRLALDLDGRPILLANVPFNVVVDGVRSGGWTNARAELRGSEMLLSGGIGGGLEARLEIRIPAAGNSAFDYALTLWNGSAAPVRITEADSFSGRLPRVDWQGLSFTSRWGEEFEPVPFAVRGDHRLECRSGRSSLGHNPFLGLTGPLGALALAPVWSGNWHIELTDAPEGIGLAAGISPWKFWVDLAPGQVFEAPSVLVAVGDDLDAATLALTRAVGATLPRSKASEAMPLEWNHWWPYEDKEITEAVFLANAGIATELGFEVSTLDAGWFGAADADTFWWDIRGDFDKENRARFPHGIGALAEAVRACGQRFGIWMEIEAVGLKADIRRTHPELMARRDDDPPETPLDSDDPGFLGYICLGSESGRRHVRQLLETLVDKTKCEWIKVDFNLDPKAGCSCTGHGHGAGDGLYAHYRGLYEVFDAFRAAHPEVVLEACASGGLRVDAGIARHVHCIFLSDPDWVPHHLALLHGTSHLLPPAAMLHWPMSEWRGAHPQQTLRLSDPSLTPEVFDAILRAAYMHRFGLSWRLPELPLRWRQRLKAHLALYRDHALPLLRHGDLRRLSGPPRRQDDGELQPKFQLSSDDRHLLLGFSLGPFGPTFGLAPAGEGLHIVPRALAPERRYRLRELSADGPGEAVVRTGADWMAFGLLAPVACSYAGLLEPL